jgi:hypothetical protein
VNAAPRSPFIKLILVQTVLRAWNSAHFALVVIGTVLKMIVTNEIPSPGLLATLSPSEGERDGMRGIRTLWVFAILFAARFEAMRGQPKHLMRAQHCGNAMSAAFVLALWCAVLHASAADVSDGHPLKYEAPASLAGTIYDAAGTNVLFKFKRTATRSGTNLNVLREYTGLDGKLAARETVVYRGDQLVSYTLDELQIGAKGRAKILYEPSNKASGKIEFNYLLPNGKLEKAGERLQSETLASDMVGPFLSDHWADLMNGREVKCRYLVIPRKETVGFTFAKHAETTWRGKPVVVIRMEPSSWLISRLVDPLFFTIEKNGQHRVLQYTGRTTPKIKSKAAWKDLDAVTIFDWE